MYVPISITCADLFDRIHNLTAIPLSSFRITKGSLEIYPNQELLPWMGNKSLFLTLKLRLLGGVRHNQEQYLALKFGNQQASQKLHKAMKTLDEVEDEFEKPTDF